MPEAVGFRDGASGPGLSSLGAVSMLTQALVAEAIGKALQSERLPPSALAELQERKWA